MSIQELVILPELNPVTNAHFYQELTLVQSWHEDLYFHAQQLSET